MNEHTKKLLDQALDQAVPETWTRLSHEQMIKLSTVFAELIVRECAGLCSQAAEKNARTFYTVSETKEVGPALVAKGSQVQAEKLAKQIKEHFGVEE